MIPLRVILGTLAIAAFTGSNALAESPTENAGDAAKTAAQKESEFKARYDRAQAALEKLQREFGGRNAALEAIILTEANTVVDYLKYLGNPRIPELESALPENPLVAARYAGETMKRRWREAEPVIIREPFAAAHYAENVLRAPWPEAEPVIFANGNAAAWYSESFSHRLTPEARALMLDDPWGCANFAHFAGKRMPELEPVILRNAEACVHYARGLESGRWTEAEKVISGNRSALIDYLYFAGAEATVELAPRLLELGVKDAVEGLSHLSNQQDLTPLLPLLQRIPEAAALRRKLQNQAEPEKTPTRRNDIILNPDTALALARQAKKRMPEAEPLILRDARCAADYARHVIRDRWPEAEPLIRAHGKAAAEYAVHVLKTRWPEAEHAILTHPEATREYMSAFIRSRWPEAEPVLMTHAHGATEYARSVLKARWPEAEPVIAESAYAAPYALTVMRKRWPEAEARIAEDPYGAEEYARTFRPDGWPEAVLAGIRSFGSREALYETLPESARAGVEDFILKRKACHAVIDYAKIVRKSRWPEGEALLLQKRDSERAAQYASEVIRGRWPEAEGFIARNPNSALNYASCALHARWPEAEPVIRKDPQSALAYALRVMHARWPEAEPAIFKHLDSSTIQYAEKTGEGRIPALERALLANKSDWSASLLVDYAARVVKSRWPEAEAQLIREPGTAAIYAQNIIGARWPEAEAGIMTHAGAARYYAKHVLRRRWPEAEPAILADLEEAAGYAVEILHSRWPELETRLIQNTSPTPLSLYHKSLIKIPWPEAEQEFARSADAALQYAQTIGRRFPSGEATILTDTRASVDYARDILKARWPEAEQAILSKTEHAVRYAVEVIKGRWPEAERRIIADGYSAFIYMREVLRGPCPEAEPLLARDAQTAVTYAQTILHARFPAGEPAIAQNAGLSVIYARILGTRFPAGEPAIFKSPQETMHYVRMLGKRFPEAEPTLLKDAEAAAEYATGILRARWPEAEPVIAQNYSATTSYNGYFPGAIVTPAQVAAKTAWGAFNYALEQKKRFPEGEAAILAEPVHIIRYASEIIGGRWPEGEAVILKNAHLASAYADVVMHARWPEAEPTIRTKAEPALRYAKRVIRGRWPEAEETLRRDAYAAAAYAGIVIGGRWPEAETFIRRKPHAILAYALLAVNGRWPEAEEDLKRNPSATIDYALWIRRTRWPEVESEIMGGYRNIGAYLKSFVPGPDKSLEKLLLARMEEESRKPAHLDSQLSSLCHAATVYVEISRRSRWSEVEPFLLGQTDYAIRYVPLGLDHARWPELESRILEDMKKKPAEFPRQWDHIRSYLSALNKNERPPEDFTNLLLDKVFADAERSSNHYLQFGYDVTERNLPGLEKRLLAAIAKHPEIEEWVSFAAAHAKYRQTRWPELEPYLIAYPGRARDYRMHFKLLREPWPELEKKLIAADDAKWLKSYRDELNTPDSAPIKFTPPPTPGQLTGKDLQFTLNNPAAAVYHVREVIKGRWPEYEARLLANPKMALEPAYYDQHWRTGRSNLGAYVQTVAKPCPELEALLEKSSGDALMYSGILNAEFPAGEPAIAKSRKLRQEYLQFFGIRGDARMDWRRLFAGGPDNPYREAALDETGFPDAARSGKNSDEPWEIYRWMNSDPKQSP